jgi:hypothetical protein
LERLTTAEAVKRTGASRFAIHRAKNKGELHPVRGNDGRFMFDPAELDAWADQRARTVAQPLRAEPAPEAAHAAAHAEIERLRAALTVAEALTARAEADRDRWHAMADKLAARPRWWPFK